MMYLKCKFTEIVAQHHFNLYNSETRPISHNPLGSHCYNGVAQSKLLNNCFCVEFYNWFSLALEIFTKPILYPYTEYSD